MALQDPLPAVVTEVGGPTPSTYPARLAPWQERQPHDERDDYGNRSAAQHVGQATGPARRRGDFRPLR